MSLPDGGSNGADDVYDLIAPDGVPYRVTFTIGVSGMIWAQVSPLIGQGRHVVLGGWNRDALLAKATTYLNVICSDGEHGDNGGGSSKVMDGGTVDEDSSPLQVDDVVDELRSLGIRW